MIGCIKPAIPLLLVLFFSACLNEDAKVRPVDMDSVLEMGFFDGGHIIFPKDSTVEFTGIYSDAGFPNGSTVDVFVFSNNSVKWNHMFLTQKLDAVHGEYLKVAGKVLENDTYGYAQLVSIGRWEKVGLGFDNQAAVSLCTRSIQFNSKELSKLPLSDIAKWQKDSLKGYSLGDGYFSNMIFLQSFPDFENGKSILSFVGERIPPITGILNRSARVYCIYDPKTKQAEKLVLTIQGELQE